MIYIVWALLGFVFFGVWAEIAINVGIIGVVFGWFPAFAVCWFGLALFGLTNKTCYTR